MTAKRPYTAWLEHGRRHQWEGSAIDAMLCFRRARRANPRASDAPFHLGEVLWQLGRIPDAIVAWREAVSINAGHLAPNLALAEGLLAVGDAAGARDAAGSALSIAPGHARAEIARAIARLLLRDDDGAVSAIRETLDREPALLAMPTIAGPLALALDRDPAAAGREPFLAALVPAGASLAGAPALLLALVIENAARGTRDHAAVTAMVAVARDREYAPAEHEALRRIALTVIDIDIAAGNALAARYATLCAAAFAAPMPHGWPRRCAGRRIRLIVLLPSHWANDAARASTTLLMSLPRDAFDIAVATIGPASTEVRDAASALAPGFAELPALPDAAIAKSLAARDPDVLLDLAGLDAAAAPLLAQRPARAIWTVGRAHAIVPPLADRAFADGNEMIAALRALFSAHDVRGDSLLDAPGVAVLWEDAVRTHQQGDRVAARAAYSRVLDLQPGFAAAHYLRGVLEREDGNAVDARADFAAALAAAPAYVDARLAAIRAALDEHDLRAGVALCEEGLSRDPANVALWRTLGHAQLMLRDGNAATAAFERALALGPDDGETHYNHGVALQMRRALPEAARAYQRALAFDPGMIAADFNLGVLFQEQGEMRAAIAAYRAVLKASPRYASAYKNLGELLFARGRIDAWLANFERFEANCPAALPLAVQALEVCQHLGDYARLERYLAGLRREAFQADDELQLADCIEELLYLLLFFDVEPEMILKFAQTYDATARRVYGEMLPRPAARRPGRPRIGYLSGDLRDHVMGKMMWQAIRHHDRARFQLFFYSLSSKNDDWTERFRGIADGFDVMDALSERAAALRIAEDDLDILVDLSTHTKGAKPGILAFKPARVQITHVASAGTVGLSAVDFKLTDRYADLPENQAFQQEALLVMEGCVYPYRHIAPATEHPFRREALGIPAGTVVIGAFVTALKLSRRCLALWREVLLRIPRAKLLFSPVNVAARGAYLRLADAAGIAVDRLLFVPQGRSDAENQGRYELVDFVLDTMPFGGVNGTLEALDMGVPVVTLAGRRHGERTSYTILANLGVTETVASSGPDYVELAVRLADDAGYMARVRAAIRERIASSPLTDMAAHTRNLESAYLAALRERSPEVVAAIRSGDV